RKCSGLGLVMLVAWISVPIPGHADVLCSSNANGSVSVRSACKNNESQLNPEALGIGPAADRSVRVCRVNPILTSVPTNTEFALPFDSVKWDTFAFFDVTQPTRLTARAAGKYYIFANIGLEDGLVKAGARSVSIRLNGEASGVLLATQR